MAIPKSNTETAQAKEWRSIPGYEGLYEASNFGKIRRINRGRQRRSYLIRAHVGGRGYPMVTLSKDGKPKCRGQHIWVLMAFVGRPPLGHVANHIDGVKTNPCPENLEWVTPKENRDHAIRTGLWPLGDRHWSRRRPDKVKRGINHYMKQHPEKIARGEAIGSSKLNDLQVRVIKRLLAMNHLTQLEIARVFKVVESNIGSIKNGRSWKHV